MNPTSADPTAPPPQPPQPPRSSFSCDRHPAEQFTGFCPSCLCERLTTLDKSSSNTPSSSRRPSSASAAAAAAIKSLFSSNPKPNNFPPPPPAPPKPSKPSSFFPELRRTKSFSASKNEALGLSVEPQRKSCDVKVRNTLSSLFTLDDGSKAAAAINYIKPSSIPVSSIASTSHHNPPTAVAIESYVASRPVFEETENEEDFKDPDYVQDPVVVYDDDDDDDDDGDEIRPVRGSVLENMQNAVENEANSGDSVEEGDAMDVNKSLKPMKDHINLHTQEKKSSGGGFWAAASVFSNKWHKWRRKQKVKKQAANNFPSLPVEKPISKQFRETQSEIADYGFGRRSCDTDPRFSLDAARRSSDDPRYSFDEPRASWDGYLIGKSFPRMPPMVSVMEDDIPTAVRVPRPDMQIPVEDPLVNCGNVGESLPGGSMQTREYYLDSSSRRRKSLDRSSSSRKSVVGEIDEVTLVSSNAKVSPTTADLYHGAKVMVGADNNNNNININLWDMNSNSNSQSLRDDCSENFELGSSGGFRDSSNSFVGGDGDRKESKKSRRWSWRIWGFSFINRRNNNNGGNNNNNKCSRANGVERSFSQSWTENGDLRGRFSRNMFRSNSSVSWRHDDHIGGSFGSMRKPGVEMNGKKRRDNEFVMGKNRSARYSPNHVDNGLLRFYFAPMRNSRKGGMASNSNSIARSVLKLY